ncbi:C40 family peptidase [Paenibacillus filicis]|uniref:C40 family peptidase n=1 Tax=Paenibacillus gyeongsangnamensis TaxID=3388067 RepID=A0ABT4Q5T9_9BACL|nr:C40 family peptidase [Paenibacillus filicis]MCZ8512238.1 C40 family peptidase [Paenibacillus filicis]
MNTLKRNRLSKTLLGITLSFSLLAAGNMALGTPQAHAASVSASSTANNVIATGKRFMGVRYQFGAPSGSTKSFDCSSFTQYAFKQNGINIPRSSRQQSQVGTYVPRSQLKPGDLVFFYSPIHHVGIYMGNGKILHTFGKGGVTISDLNSSWWSSHYTTARRVIN